MGIFNCKKAIKEEELTPQLKKEIESIISEYDLNCSLEDFEEKVSWSTLSYHNENLSEAFIEYFRDKVSWSGISFVQTLSEPFIEKFQDEVNWDYISEYQTLSESFIEKYKYRVYWDNISRWQKLSEAFVEKYEDKIDFDLFMRNKYCPPRVKIKYMREKGLIGKEDPNKHIIEYDNKNEETEDKDLEELKKLVSSNGNWYKKAIKEEELTPELKQEIQNIIKDGDFNCSIEDFEKKANWDEISCNGNLSEAFIEKFNNLIEWEDVAIYNKLSERLIEKFQDKINWEMVCRNQELSERLIEKFQDKVNWESIAYFQKLSEPFIEKHKDKVDWHSVSASQNLSEAFIEKFQNKVDWNAISSAQKLSDPFVEKHKDKINFYLLADNEYCPPRIKIKLMREKGLIGKEDPNKHIIEYDNDNKNEVTEDKDLEELKKLVSSNDTWHKKSIKEEELTPALKQEIEGIIKKYDLDCTVENFENKVDWNLVSRYKYLSEEFIEKFQDKLVWQQMCVFQKMSEEFIEKYQGKVHWLYISRYQKLSEKFIEKYDYEVSWSDISGAQDLSEYFIEKHQDKIDFDELILNPNCPARIRIDLMREKGLIGKEDPNRHVIEYDNDNKNEVAEDKDLEELKKLVSSNNNWYKKAIKEEELTPELKQEIEGIIKHFNLKCSLEEFEDKVDYYQNWAHISCFKYLSEAFMEYFQGRVIWRWISYYQKLSEPFIEKHQDSVYWPYISMHQTLSEPFIEKFQNKVDWHYISHGQKLSEPFIEKFQNRVVWSYISLYQKLSEAFIEKFQDRVDWDHISRYQKLSENFIKKHKRKILISYLAENPDCPPRIKIQFMREQGLIGKEDPNKHIIEYDNNNKNEVTEDKDLEELKKLVSSNGNWYKKAIKEEELTPELKKEIEKIIKGFNLKCSLEEFEDKADSYRYWENISCYQYLSEAFMEKFQDKVFWKLISRYQKLSEVFMEKFQNKVEWSRISFVQKLSEPFIEKFQNKVDWNYISHGQTLSEQFIEKYKYRVYWPYISHYQKLSESFIEKFQDRVDWDNISRYQKLSESFIEKHKDKIYSGDLMENPDCPPRIKIKLMREKGLIGKEDPNKHIIEYDNKNEVTEDKDLEELKKLVSSNNNWYKKAIKEEELTPELKQEIEEIIKHFNLKCSLEEFEDKVDYYQNWAHISCFKYLSEAFMEYFQGRVIWRWISYYQKLSEEFIEKFQNKVDWNYISSNQTLSEAFMEKFQDKLNWELLSIYQKLSESFIEKFKDKVDWYNISAYQKLSESFIGKNKYKIDFGDLMKNPNCPPRIKIKLMREKGLIGKEDPNKHIIEYDNDNKNEVTEDKDLEELKKLVSSNGKKLVTALSHDKSQKYIKVNKIIDSFWKNFDEYDFHKTNREIQYLLSVLSPLEKNVFLRNIKTGLYEKGISVDSFCCV